MRFLTLIATTAAVHVVSHSAFKVDGVDIDYDEDASIEPPPNNMALWTSDDSDITEAKKELKSAENNAGKGSLNNEMSIALIGDIKQKLSQVESHM